MNTKTKDKDSETCAWKFQIGSASFTTSCSNTVSERFLCEQLEAYRTLLCPHCRKLIIFTGHI